MPEDYVYTVKDGRKVILDEVFQSKTYGSLLEGAVSEKVNRFVLDGHARRARQIWPNDPCIILGLDSYLARLAQALPPITCAGHFLSFRTARNAERMASSLVLVWFQDEIFERPGERMAEWMMGVPWNEVAHDFDW
jgi:hypothetical protein